MSLDEDYGPEDYAPEEVLDDGTDRDIVHCKVCESSWDLSDTYGIGGRSVCPDCIQDEIEKFEAINAELLAACKEALSAIDEAYKATGHFKVAATSEQRMKIETAIAKAEGGTE